MFADSRTSPTKFQVGAWRQLQYLRNMLRSSLVMSVVTACFL